MEHIINIYNDKCIGCSKCILDCPENNIKLNDNKKAEIKWEKCMFCGHCSAICPEEAIEISGFSDKVYNVENLEKISPEKLMNSLISRRSIRNFKNIEVEKEIIENILKAGQLSPTAKNMQDVEYIVITENKEKIEKIAVSIFKKILKIINIFSKKYRDFEIDDNFFFKKAPLVIVIFAKDNVDGSLAASNISLMAESYGLGVLYSGFFTFAYKISSKLKKELYIKNKKIVTTLVIGYPKVKYKRSAQREDVKVTYI